MRVSPPLSVDADDVAILRGWIADGAEGAAAVRRARIVLLSAGGHGPSAVSGELGCSKQTVITWRERYRREGLAGLYDAPRSGRPATVNASDVVRRTLEPPAAGAGRWSSRRLAAELGISNVAVANVWRAWGIRPARAGSVHVVADPVLDATVSTVAGLHVDPSVHVMAVLVNDSRGADADRSIPVERRSGVGARVGGLDVAEPDAAALGRFLARLEVVRSAVPEHGAVRLALLASTANGAVGHWVRARPDVALHRVPAEQSWTRLAHVVGLLAGAGGDGAASVRALDRALADHPADRVFSWTHVGPPVP